jgi:galactose mutarotase-like enzyme
MPMHGFASDQDFSVAAADATTCTLELSDTAVTRRHYPYRFRLSVTFTLARDGVTITTRIANPGPRPLPASFGIHPGFAWPLLPGTDKSDYSLRFPSDQTLIYTRPVNRLIAPSRQTLRLIRGELPLTEDLFAEGGLLLLTPRSRSLSYGCAAGLRIVLEYPDFPQLLLWMRPGGSFICIEPCRGFADPVDFDDDFSRKPGLIMIGPGSAESFSFRIVVVAT